GRHLDVEVNAVEQRPADLGQVALDHRAIDDVLPGRYYVRFDPDVTARFGEGTSSTALLATYHPHASSLVQARPVSVAPGEVLSSIDIVARAGAGSTVSGRLLLGGRPPSVASLQLLGRPEEPSAWIVGGSVLDDEGGFLFSNVAPGEYRLFYLVGNEGGISAGAVDLTVADGKLPSLRVDVPEPVSLRGRLLIEGTESTSSNEVIISLMPEGNIMHPACTSKPSSDGGFLLLGCSPGLYHVRVTSLPEGHYVEQVLSGRSPVRDPLLRLDREAPELKVLLRRGAARIRGRLASRNPAWYLITAETESWPRAFGIAGRDGVFTVDHLPPGRYSVVGMSAPVLSALHDSESLRALQARGADVFAAEGEHLEVTTPVVSETPEDLMRQR
ncbi:MAG: hypothetical protein NZM33_17350, partial [Bryobacteraceae bacterium]|nr:hypothetical protein [Bryobacteraceae bacterium]